MHEPHSGRETATVLARGNEGERERAREEEEESGWGEEGLEREGERRGRKGEVFRFRSANSFHLMRSEEALDQS